jgi:hypothetical protein
MGKREWLLGQVHMLSLMAVLGMACTTPGGEWDADAAGDSDRRADSSPDADSDIDANRDIPTGLAPWRASGCPWGGSP